MISDNCDYELDEVPDWQAFRKLGKLNFMTPTQHREDQEMETSDAPESYYLNFDQV